MTKLYVRLGKGEHGDRFVYHTRHQVISRVDNLVVPGEGRDIIVSESREGEMIERAFLPLIRVWPKLPQIGVKHDASDFVLYPEVFYEDDRLVLHLEENGDFEYALGNLAVALDILTPVEKAVLHGTIRVFQHPSQAVVSYFQFSEIPEEYSQFIR